MEGTAASQDEDSWGQVFRIVHVPILSRFHGWGPGPNMTWSILPPSPNPEESKLWRIIQISSYISASKKLNIYSQCCLFCAFRSAKAESFHAAPHGVFAMNFRYGTLLKQKQLEQHDVDICIDCVDIGCRIWSLHGNYKEWQMAQ